MTLTSTDIVAWWGAIVATIVLIWDVIKWSRTGPRLRVRIKPNTIFRDSEEVLIHDDGQGGKRYSVKPSIYIELVNVGGTPTTIMNVCSERTFDKGTAGNDGTAFVPHFGKQLPHMLVPGEVWSCRVDQESTMKLPGEGPIKVLISASHRNKPVIARISPQSSEANTVAGRCVIKPRSAG